MDETLELREAISEPQSVAADGIEDLENARNQTRVEQKRFSQIISFAPDAQLITDDKGVIRETNSAAVALLGVPKSRLVGSSLINFIAPESVSGFPSNLPRSIPGSIVRIYESMVKPENDPAFACSFRVTPLASADTAHPDFIWLLRDISERSPLAFGDALDEKAVQYLYDIASGFGARPSRRSWLKSIADRLKTLFQARALVLYLYDSARGDLELEIAKGIATIPGTHVHLGEGIIGMTAQDRELRLLESYHDWPFLEPQSEDLPLTVAVAPMLCFDGLLGVVAIAQSMKAARPYSGDDVRLLSVFASLAGLMMDAVHSNETAKQERVKRKRAERDFNSAKSEIQNLSAKIEVIREEERKQLARQIHDELGQQLTGFKLDLNWLAKNQQAILEKSQSLLRLSDSTIESVQRISTELRPGVLDELGLVRAIEWQAKDFESRCGIECASHVNIHEQALDRGLSTAVFRILQEALTNIVRHSHATRTSIELTEEKGHLLLEVEDNGCGIEESKLTSPRSLGLLGMRERAQAFGGKVEISGSPNQGTTVSARFPLKNQSEETSP